jgi:hypothetical protein
MAPIMGCPIGLVKPGVQPCSQQAPKAENLVQRTSGFLTNRERYIRRAGRDGSARLQNV